MGDRRRKADIESSVEKPTPLEFNPDGFPAELKELKRFTHWRFQRKDKKWSKVPRCRSQAGSSTNPNTWMTFDYALKYFLDLGQRNGLDGLGFVFSKDDPFAGVDLDDCRDPDTGAVDDWAAAIVKTLDSYTEVSPSRTGFKVWVRGKKPPGVCKVKYESGEVEVYDQGRYFCMTGHRLDGTPATVNERQEQLDAVYRQVFGKQPVNGQAEDKKAANGAGPSPFRFGGGNGPLNDDEVISHARRAKNAAKFKALWDGDTSGHGGDDSKADLALCALLAFWCGRDPEQMDRLFRQSGLYRDKWDDPRGESTYGEQTIAVAVAGCHTVYERPNKPAWPRRGKGKKTADPSANGDGSPAPGSGEHPPCSPDDSDEADVWDAMGYGIILRHFRDFYAPVFRRGQIMHSATFGRDMKMGELCSAPGLKLVKLLTEALDVPRSGPRPDLDAIPSFFRTWAPSAWKDLLAELPEEEASGVVAESAEDEFRGKVATALLHHASLGYCYENNSGEWVTETQRRTLIHWCRIFAKAKWADIRGYQIWCRKDDDTGLQVAVRKELFGQVQGCTDLARMSLAKFTRLCEAYQVGTGGREGTRIRGARVVLLAPEYLAYLLEHPTADDTSNDTGQTHAGVRENDVEMCHDDGQPPSGQGVNRDTSCDTSCDTSAQDAQCGTDPPF